MSLGCKNASSLVNGCQSFFLFWVLALDLMLVDLAKLQGRNKKREHKKKRKEGKETTKLMPKINNKCKPFKLLIQPGPLLVLIIQSDVSKIKILVPYTWQGEMIVQQPPYRRSIRTEISRTLQISVCRKPPTIFAFYLWKQTYLS